jgi:hypothetical protein
MRVFFLLFFLTSAIIQAYNLGRGYEIDKKLHLGGYFSTDYSISKDERLFRLDDVAVMAYGDLSDELSYMVELEAAPVYTYEYKNKNETNSLRFHKERFYIDYKISQNLNIRAGKQITPIGYWNLEPINVLRETSSNPKLSREIFPKFVSGIDLYGYVPNFESLTYHLFGQNNKDLDEEYINIKNSHFFGFSLENEVDYDFSYGGSLGEFISDDNKRSRFLQLNAKHDFHPFYLQYEAAISSITDNTTNQKSSTFASYIQSEYKIDMKNSIIGRYEYYKDNLADDKQHIGIIGYSYRPLYSVSLKSEYQFNSNSDLNKFIISFSVLF